MHVVFLGGLQARLLFDIFRRQAREEDKADFVDVTRPIERQHEELLAKADMLALEARGTPPAVDLDDIGARGERIWFPQLALDFLWPFGGQPHIRNTRDRHFAEGPFPVELGDAYLNRRLESRTQTAAIEADYLALDVASIVDLDAYLRLTFARQQDIDRACNCDFAGRIAREFRLRPLFLNPLRPAPDLIREVAQFLLPRLRPGLSADLPDEGDTGPEAPIHPSVAAHFGLKWAERRLYRLREWDRVDYPEYVRRYLSYAEGPELEAGLRLVALGRPEEGLPLMQVGAARPVGRRSQTAHRVFASAAALVSGEARSDAGPLLVAHRRLKDAEAETLKLLQQRPEDIAILRLLAEIREKLGDRDGQVDALRKAALSAPNDPGLLSQLTLALASNDDLPGAIASAQAEVALDPSNPHCLAFLSTLLIRAGQTQDAQACLTRAIELLAETEGQAALREELTQRLAELQAGA